MANSTQIATLTHNQQKFVTALLGAASIIEACKKVGISDETARRWMKEPHVKQAIEEASAFAFNHALERLKSGVNAAVDTLLNTLTDNEPNATRVRAALAIISTSFESVKLQFLIPQPEQDYSAYDLRELLRFLTPEQRELVKPIFAEAAAKKVAEQDPANNIHSIQRVG
jgi:hypothetical protein